MQPHNLMAMGCALLLLACAPDSPVKASRATKRTAPHPHPDLRTARQATRSMVSVVADAQASSIGSRPGANRTAGDLWIEVGRLKRDGHNVKTLEWQVSELEENLRSRRQDSASRRHLLNNLEYELQALKRRQH